MNTINILLIIFLSVGCGSNTKEEKLMNSGKPNKLINERSPYLLQHAYNPVDWYPWSEAAIEKAKKENKPIFLSIGYSTCHWCHVMEHESFEDTTVAKLMNDVFVSIKVDREERPDIDNIYMTVCQMMTGHGGWPMTIIMTPDKKPFFAGTYFPKESRYGRIGIIDLIKKIDHAWKNQHDEILKSAESITKYLSDSQKETSHTSLDKSIINKAIDDFANRFDNEYGGFGNAPKFPSPHNLLFLLRNWMQTGNENVLKMVETTLQMMSLGGIHDHLGGGFHRYSTDRKWILPHFEKMLYDQAMLTLAYTETYAATGNGIYKSTAKSILEYVLRDMTSPEGGFYSAEDADSEGEEGKFYVWSKAEVKEILNEEDSNLFFQVFNFENDGNFKDEATKSKNGKNILYLSSPITDAGLSRRIEKMKRTLFNEREKRVHPFKDDKILTDWNGLMIGALAKAGIKMQEPKYIDAAERAFNFVNTKLKRDNKLLHRFRNGEAAIEGKLDDYAYLGFAAMELYRSTFNPYYLESAIGIYNHMIDKFADEENGGFFLTSNEQEQLLIRPKELYDGAIPSGNSIAYYTLNKLYKLTANDNYLKYINSSEKIYSGNVANSPTAFTMFLTAYSSNVFPGKEIVILEGENGTEEILKVLNKNYLPDVTVLLVPSGEDRKDIDKLAPFTKDYETIDNLTTMFVCENFVCNLPTTSINEALQLMDIKSN